MFFPAAAALVLGLLAALTTVRLLPAFEMTAALCAMLAVALGAAPGLLVAWQLFRVGPRLLRREPGAAREARGAAAGAGLLNAGVLLVVLCFMAPAASGRALLRDVVLTLVVRGTVGYALASLAQAWLLGRAARVLEAFEDGRARVAPAPAPAADGGC
jgi:hypothetical protein